MYFVTTGDRCYDVFLLSSTDQNDISFVNQRLLQPLEQFYNICWPERDSDVGAGEYPSIYLHASSWFKDHDI